jgi:phenylacetate-CoA ligase
LNSLLSAYVVYPLAERLEGRAIRPKIAALRRHYALTGAERRAVAASRLADVVACAGAQVPYYRDLFARTGFAPEKLRRDPAFLSDVPFLTKDIVREQGERLLSRALASGRHHRVKTGGSTGPSAFFYLSQEAADWSSAVTSYARERIGATRRQVQLHLAAELANRPGAWLRRELLKDIAMNRVNVYFDRVDDVGLAHISDAIKRHTPYLVHAHPSTIYLLARFAARSQAGQRDAPAFRVFESSGEVLEAYQRKAIANTFGCRVVNRYGLAEFGVVAYELDPAAGSLEVLDSEGWFENRRSPEDDVPELVITGFHNDLMPLIRYRTGDLAQLTDEDGVWRLAGVVGRMHELVPINGVPHATHHVQDVLDHKIGDIDEFQIDLRTRPPTLRLIAAAGADQKTIAGKVDAFWPNAFSLAFIRPDELIRVGHRAKFRHVITGASVADDVAPMPVRTP